MTSSPPPRPDAIGAEPGATAPQLLLARLLARSPVVLPIPGTASLAPLEQNVAAADLRLNGAQLRSIDKTSPSRSAAAGYWPRRWDGR